MGMFSGLGHFDPIFGTVRKSNTSRLDPLGLFKQNNPKPDTYASDTFAAVTRQQWADYVNNFIPIENKLISYATDPGVVTDAMKQASTDVTNSFGAQQAATDRRLKGLGVALSPDEQAASNRQFSLSKSLADVQAQNVAGDLTRQRQQGILGNPAPTTSGG